VKQSLINAWKLKCKSCTVYRDGSRTMQVLNIGTGENIASLTGEVKKIEAVKTITNAPLDLKTDRGRIAPRVRPDVLPGRTYRMKTGYGKLYVTINNDENGVPFEVFATIGKSGGFFQEQSEAICRLISLTLRSGVKVEEVIKDLRGIRGPAPTITAKGTILSLPDAISHILEEHVRSGEVTEQVLLNVTADVPVGTTVSEIDVEFSGNNAIADFGFAPGCPECGSPLTMAEGCISCKSCGFSRCG
jgi:ribonucleoside-diphosphate reductase alpha chain